MKAETDLHAMIADLRRHHVYCEDCWYSCPKATDGCCDDSQGDDCNCGADEHNARVDELAALLSGRPSPNELSREQITDIARGAKVGAPLKSGNSFFMQPTWTGTAHLDLPASPIEEPTTDPEAR